MQFHVTELRQEVVEHPNRVLKDFLLNLLKYIIEPSDLNLYVSPQAMKIWERAFTPEFTDPWDNLENAEYRGDRVLKTINPLYLLKRLTDYTEAEVSKTDMLIMEKKTQSDLAIEMGLTHYLKSDKKEVNISIYGDLFESFFGALDEVAELVMEYMGLIICDQMNRFIFNQNTIPRKLKEGDIKMNVEQIFIQLGLTQPIVKVDFVDGNNHVSITLTNEQQQFFKDHGIYINNVLVGSAVGKSKNITIKNAYAKVKRSLEYFGVNDQFIAKIKDEKEKREVVEKEQKEIVLYDIKQLVIDMISPVIKDKKEMEKYYLNSDAMVIWEAAMDQVNKTTKYQFIGEVILKGLVPRHLMKLHKDDIFYDKQKYNDILANIQKNYHIYVEHELLKGKYYFESFFGAFYEISDALLEGVGLINSYKLVEVVIADKTLAEFAYKHPKMYFDQLLVPFFEKGKGKLIVEEEHELNHHVYNLYLSKEQLDFLKQQGFNIKDRLVGHAEGTLKKQTEREAYDNARMLLEKYGVNEKWAFMKKEQMKFDDPEISVYKKLIERENMQRGFDYVYFRLPIKTTTLSTITMQLIGINTEQNKKELLASIVYDKNKNNVEARISLIKQYLNIK